MKARSFAQVAFSGLLLAWPILMVAITDLAAQGSPRTATAVASVLYGIVVRIDITDGGSGYVNPPGVTITGGGGGGAEATAFIMNGSVSMILLNNSGSGYTSAPTVIIDDPPPAATETTMAIRTAPLLEIDGEPGVVQEIQYADALGDTNMWFTLTNLLQGSGPIYFADTSIPPEGKRYYRTETYRAPNPQYQRWVWIHTGTFTMGSPDSEIGHGSDEGPQTVVTLTNKFNGFFMGKYLVTQAEYLDVMKTNPSVYRGNLECPVENVSWIDASNYCQTLTDREGTTLHRLPEGWVYRLPTEAEWEYACRAGTTTRFYYGDDLLPIPYAHLTNYAWYIANSTNKTHQVGQLLPNKWGLYDMSGNLWEWCLDAYVSSLPGGHATNYYKPGPGSHMVYRGGGFDSPNTNLRSACRNNGLPNSKYLYVGFRVIIAPDNPSSP